MFAMKSRVISVIITVAIFMGVLVSMPSSAIAADMPSSCEVMPPWSPGVSVPWGSDLFAQPSNVYNSDLSLAAMALSRLVHHQTEKSLEVFGFEGHYKMYNANDKGLPEYTIISQTMSVGGETFALIILAMQGTSQAAQWMVNFNVSKTDYFGYSVHAGFKGYADEVWQSLQGFLAETQGLPSKRKLLITGHSSGGACANLLALRLAADAQQTFAKKDDIYVYGFATPNFYVGNQTSRFDNVFNIVNTADIIPRLPGNPLDPNGALFPAWRKFGQIRTFTTVNEKDPHSIGLYFLNVKNSQPAQEAPQLTFKFFFEWLPSLIRLIFSR